MSEPAAAVEQPPAQPPAQPTPPAEAKPEPPAPTFTQADIDRIVKDRLSREGLAGLKAKAAEHDKMMEAQKSAEQRAAEALAKAQADVAEAKADALRARLALTHGVSDEHLDLLGTGDEETLTARATRIGDLLKAASERDQLKAELEAVKAGKPAPSVVPVANLKPGASPANEVSEDDAFPAHWIPQRAV